MDNSQHGNKIVNNIKLWCVCSLLISRLGQDRDVFVMKVYMSPKLYACVPNVA